jgi:hypothetical protein
MTPFFIVTAVKTSNLTFATKPSIGASKNGRTGGVTIIRGTVSLSIVNKARGNRDMGFSPGDSSEM